MISRFLAIVVIFLYGSSCSEKYDARTEISHEVRLKVASKLLVERGLVLCGFGEGGIQKIEMLALSFDCHKPLTIDEGRFLLVIATRELMRGMNEDERIRPFLVEYPMGPEGTDIRIFIKDQNHRAYPLSEASIISCIRGICQYHVRENNELKLIFQETFEEAEQKLQNSGML